MVGETRDGAEADGVVRAWERAVSHNARRRWWPWFLVMARGGEGEVREKRREQKAGWLRKADLNSSLEVWYDKKRE